MKTSTQKAWQWLGRELDQWADSGHSASFWWRDDDAVEPSGNLDKLVGLSYNWNVPLALAVIPAKLSPQLEGFLQDRSLVSVMQHGYAHVNHAEAGQRKLELGGYHPAKTIVAELKQGFQILEQQFTDLFSPVLVPPWNRIDDKLLAGLTSLGFTGISTTKARRQAFPVTDLLQINTHLDPVNWRHKGGFIGLYPSIAILIQHLQARRFGYRDNEEPTGILSHHLVQNEAVWRFFEELLRFLSDHPAVDWCDAHKLWPNSRHRAN